MRDKTEHFRKDNGLILATDLVNIYKQKQRLWLLKQSYLLTTIGLTYLRIATNMRLSNEN
jgi:hypothetical protein